jgi:hypothetical protein
MQKSSFKVITTFVLFFFLATPLSAFAQFGNPGGGNGLAQGLLLGSLLNQQGGGGQNAGLLAALALGGGGGLGGGAGGAGGAPAKVGQVLTLLGALTGNMGFLIAGMITSMIGGLGGATPQQGAVDERFVGPGAGFGSGGSGANSPYYPTPTPQAPTPTPAAAACNESIFIVKDTTATPNVTKPYPTSTSVAKNSCVLAINSDSVSHAVQVKEKDKSDVITTQTISGTQSHIFRFPEKKTYTLCVDSSASACTTVTVQ